MEEAKIVETALENLPADLTQYVLELPANKGKNFYTHVLIDWNPKGHEPAHIYDLPHFDIHFYTSTQQFFYTPCVFLRTN